MTLTLLRRRKCSLQQHSACLHDTPLWKNRHTIPLNTNPPTPPLLATTVFSSLLRLCSCHVLFRPHFPPHPQSNPSSIFFPFVFPLLRQWGNEGCGRSGRGEKEGRFASPRSSTLVSSSSPDDSPLAMGENNNSTPSPLFFSPLPPGSVLPVHFCGGQVKAENSYSQ